MVTQRAVPPGGQRGLRRDTRGLSTVEYVIILLAVGLVGIAAWRGFGAGASTRTTAATGTMGTLDGPSVTTEPAAGGGGGGRHVPGRSHLDEATADAAPPPEPAEQFAGPVMLLGAATLLVLGLVARRMLRKDGKKKG